MATNTSMNIGIRRYNEYGYFNYEPKGGADYTSARENLDWGGTLYDIGDAISYDAKLTSQSAQNDCYSDDALMEVYFNNGWVVPTVHVV